MSRDFVTLPRHSVNTTSTSLPPTMRVDEREIPGASESAQDAPNLIELRTSKRGRIPKREWIETSPHEGRKRARREIQNPTPTLTQASTTTDTQVSTTFAIHEDKSLEETIIQTPEAS